MLGLTLAALALIGATTDAFYLATDDWFFVDFGRRSHALGELFELKRTGTPAVRPLALAWARLEHLAFGDALLPRRLALIALHVLTALALRQVLTALTSRRAATWAAVAFACWPLHAEPLTWYHSGVTTIPVVALMLGSAVLQLNGRRAGSCVALALALMTRENAVVLAPTLVALDLGRGRSVREALRAAAPQLALTTAFVAWRAFQVVSALGHGGAELPFGQSGLMTAAYLTFHLVIPVHPAVPGAVVLAALTGLLALALLAGSLPQLRRAAPLMVLMSLPFAPLYDTGDPLFAVGDPEYERRWYHLYPLVLALAWPVGETLARLRTAVAASLAVGLLALQLLNARVWAEPGALLASSLQASRAALESGAPLALVLTAEPEGRAAVNAELLEHQFLDLPRILGRRALAIYKVDPDGVRAVSELDERGYPRWRGLPPTEAPSAHTRYLRWTAGAFEEVPPSSLPTRPEDSE